jgi:hypothetical protein
MSFFFFHKIREQESRTGIVWRGSVAVESKDMEKGCGRWIWCKYCVSMYVNGKERPVETIPGMGRWEIKENDGGGWIQVCYIWYILRTFVNATMHPQHNNKTITLKRNTIQSHSKVYACNSYIYIYDVIQPPPTSDIF